MAPTDEPIDPWEAARQRYLEGLTEEEAELFADASLENVYEAASTSYEAHKRSSKIRAVGEKVRPLLEAIGDYQGALDVLANTSALFLCPIWGSVRVLLQIASDFGKYFERLADMFMSIGDILPRARTYQSLFPSHEPLRMALSELYLDVMKFCTDAKNIFKHANSSSMATRMSSSVVWKPLKRRFEKAQSDFRMHRKRVEKQAVMSKCIEDAKHNELQQAAAELAEKRRQEEDRMRLLNLLSTIPYEEHHQKLRKKRHKQTGSWLRDADQFKAWVQSPVSAGLYCDGTTGTGKSVLASGVVDDLFHRDHDQKALILYYYCDHSDHRTLVPINLVGTLIKQGLIKISPCQDVEDRLSQIYLQGLRAPELEELIEVLLLLLALFDEVFLVVDGLNECDTGAQADILSLIRNLVAFQTRPIRVFVFSCDEILISKKLEDFVRLPLTEGKTQPVVTLLVKETVRSKLESGELVIRDSSLEDLIVSELIEKAHGMFLWVSFQLDDLCEAGCDDAIRKTLTDLPDGLTETYSRILTKIAKSSLKLAMAQAVFKWTICARRPLNIAEMKEATAFGPTDKCWDESKIPTDGRRLVQSCHNLAVIDEDDTVRLAHHSVQQFLLSEKLRQSNPQFSLELDSIQLNAGETCVAYLLFSDFERQVTRLGQSPGTMQTWSIQANHMALLPTLMASGTVVLSLWYRLFGRKSEKRTMQIDYSKYRKPKIQPSTDLQAKYRLLSYVIDYWEWHTMQFRDDNTSMWGAFRSLATDRTLPFEVQSWGGNQGPSHLPYLALFVWAIDRGHEGFLTLFLDPPRGLPLEKYYEFEVKRGRDPLLRAVENGHSSTLEFLIRRNHVRNFNPALLLRAVSNADEVTSLRLLENGADANGTDDVGNIPLHYAASNGSRGIVQLLLDHEAFINAVTRGPLRLQSEHRQKSSNPLADQSTTDSPNDSYTASESPFMNFPKIPKPGGLAERVPTRDEPNLIDVGSQTALQLAAGREEAEIVGILLEAGAHRNSWHGHESPALHSAIKAQNERRVTLLLGKGADTSMQSESGETALHIASRLGNDRICALLLTTGIDVNATDEDNVTALFMAVLNSHESVVRCLCLHGADVNQSSTEDELSPLHLAASLGKERILTLLIDAGADLEVQAWGGQTALHFAVHNHNITAVDRLLGNGANINATDGGGDTPLHLSLIASDEIASSRLLDAGAHVNIKNHLGTTCLESAVFASMESMVKLLLGARPDLLDEGKEGYFLLKSALEKGGFNIARQLLGQARITPGIRVMMADALLQAVRAKNKDMVELLLSQGADPDAADGYGMNSLTMAVEANQDSILQTLLRAGATLQPKDRSLDISFVPAGAAIMCNRNSMLRYLLPTGSDINCFYNDGKTFLHLAVEHSNNEAAESLLCRGADANWRDVNGLTPLHVAVRNGNLGTCNVLLNYGASPSVTTGDTSGDTSIHLAAIRGDLRIARVLASRCSPATVGYTNLAGKTAAQLAHERGHYLLWNLMWEITQSHARME